MSDITNRLLINIALKGVRIVVLLYALLLLLFFLFQSKFLYHPTRDILATPASEGLSYDDVVFHTKGGLRLTGWYVYGNADREIYEGVILFLHGNAGNISRRIDTLKILAEVGGVDTFIIDYRGYGESEGRPGEDGTYMDAIAAWNYLVKDRKVSPAKIIIYGRSLGGGVATWLATRVTPASVVLDSTFTSIPDIAGELFPFIPVKLLSRFKYDNIERVGDITSPLLIVHSRDDELIPISHARKLVSATGGRADFLEIGGKHDNGFAMSGEEFSGPLKDFIRRTLK